MSDVQTIFAGEGAQAVDVYAVDALGREAKPSGATARIVDLEYSEDADDADRIILAEAAATVDATNTVITAAAGPSEADPRKIVVTSSTGITVGRKYLLSASGLTEVFEVDRVVGTNVFAVHQLRNPFAATTSSVVGCRVSATFPSGTANDGDELDRRALFGVDWTFSGVTGPIVRRTFARIERRGPPPLATALELFDLDPQLAVVLHSRSTADIHIRQASNEIRARLLHAQHSLADTTFGDVGKQAALWLALELAYRCLGPEHEGRAVWASERAVEWRTLLLSGKRPDDAVDMTRTTDKRRGTRTRASIGAVT